MAKGDIWTIVVDSSLYIRSNPGINNPAVGALHNGDKITEIEQQDVNGTIWIHHDSGWSSSAYMKLTSKVSDQKVITNTENSDLPAATEGEGDDEGSGYLPSEDYIWSMSNSAVDASEFSNINSITGVLGLPYQFLPNTDPRLIDSVKNSAKAIGYEYADKIVTKIPLLFISPGKASFMTRYGKKQKQNIVQRLLSFGFGLSKDEDSGVLNDLFDKSGRYYTFEYDEKDYYSIVNPMCRIAARYLNIEDVQINGTKLDNLNWRDFTSSGIRGITDIGNYMAIPFYLDSETSISESMSNSTTQSMIASTVNSASDMARELRFLLGKDAGIDAIQNDSDVMSNLQNVQDIIGNLLGGNNFLGALAGHLTTVAAGGKMMFPEIWSDSQFSRSYSCRFKFISPDPSPLSVYLNLIVPLFHLMALVGPRSIKDNPNGYANPFLVRACYKGFFNIDTGIITDMSITKGAECQWTPEGIPTSMEVDITIKDLYNNMALTPTDADDWKYDTMNNTALMDYIANLCGINVFKPEIARTLDMWYVNNFENRVRDFFKVNIWGSIQDAISNTIVNDIFRR